MNGSPHWKLQVSLEQTARREIWRLDDIDLEEFGRRCGKQFGGVDGASFGRFVRAWRNDFCRRAFVPRAVITAAEGFFSADAHCPPPPRPEPPPLALVWTLGPYADAAVKTLSEGDVLVELLLEIASTLLIFGIWRSLFARVSDIVRAAELHVARIVQPEDADSIRRVFYLPAVRAMDGVSLNSHGMIVPPKSRCALVVPGSNSCPAPSSLFRYCTSCGKTPCLYEQLNLCPGSFFVGT